jgi:pimeloyl-ACP methyl ester carboxylesterase
MVTVDRNILLQGKHGRAFLADAHYIADGQLKPVVIYSHGFKGFKDWGANNLVGNAFAERGLVFIRYNFSHNGTTLERPTDFGDLEAFGNNNFSIELDDLGTVIDAICNYKLPTAPKETNTDEIYLLGHSRGGGITILKAAEDDRVKKIATWASVNEFGKFWREDEMERIKRDGVVHVTNSRTNQMMPIYWQIYQNYFDNLDRLHIPTKVKQLNKPFLAVHGTADETVAFTTAAEMKEWNENVALLPVKNADHNFGAKHPWLEDALPPQLHFVVEETANFFKA